MTFGERAIAFNEKLHYTGGKLPAGIRVMNPFTEFPDTLKISTTFFNRFYNDNHPRHLILGINPSRLGAGLTGIPFTDPKRLISECGIEYHGRMAHEPSSSFIYEMIHAFGGVEAFYRAFYINSPCPLGFTSINKLGKEVNYNYYDNSVLIKATMPFMLESLNKLIGLGNSRTVGVVLGMGKNFAFLEKLNASHHFFDRLVPLEHPRFIMQYKSKQKEGYIRKYLEVLAGVSR